MPLRRFWSERLGAGAQEEGWGLCYNTDYSQSANTQYFFTDLDGSGAADKVYWNYGAGNGGSRAWLSRY